MDQFVTTYRKDFLWPYVRSFGIKQDSGPHFGNDSGSQMCACKCQNVDTGNMLGPNIYQQEDFQKPGPSTPLMDPVLYPARVGPAPENQTQRFNQPNIFLEKLRMKYPFLYEVLRSAAPDDIISRINKDRLRTTYQVDFCHMNEYPSAPYDDLLRAAGVAGKRVCAEPVRLPGDPCRPNQKPVAFRPGTISNSNSRRDSSFTKEKCGAGGGGGGGAFGATGSGQGSGGQGFGVAISMGTSEYQDQIRKGIVTWNPFTKANVDDKSLNAWGKMIYQDRRHAHGSRSSGRATFSR